MSIVFGIRKPPGASASEQELQHMACATQRYAPDGLAVRVQGRVGMGFQPYHTHLRSRLESGPASDIHGNLLVVDGRIDNYQELCQELRLNHTTTPDSQIILAAYVRWGEECFSRLVGDWAVVLWSVKNQAMYLARDHAGTRTLYFEDREGSLLWSTYLDSFFTHPTSTDIDAGYAACYLSAQPVRDLTPYKGIRSVLPAHFIFARDCTLLTTPHWHWMSKATIRYSSDNEYEEHFFAFLAQSVERRDDPGAPALAQLSGGMDSTSIVCTSDHIRKLRNEPELLDTISFFDDSEPTWDEKPYFSIVETARRKTGIHLETSYMDRTFEPHDATHGAYLLPGADSSTIERESRIQASIAPKEYRSILSGIGGDEVLGGVPRPEPELANYLTTGQFGLLLKQTLRWCLTDRRPFVHALLGVAKYTYDLYTGPRADQISMPPWITESLQKTYRGIAKTDVTSHRCQGLTPSSISQGLAWWSIMETLPHAYPGILSRPEYRYPYLDRQLVDYLFSIPREQLLRPGRRRSLMRRALKGIVPHEVLERRRKAYQVRGPLVALQQARHKVDRLFSNARICQMGFVDPARLRAAIDLSNKTSDVKLWLPIVRAIALELFLQGNEVAHSRNARSDGHNQHLLRMMERTRSG